MTSEYMGRFIEIVCVFKKLLKGIVNVQYLRRVSLSCS